MLGEQALALPMATDWKAYDVGQLHGEHVRPSGQARPGVGPPARCRASLSDEELRSRKQAAELAIHIMGATFTMCGAEGNIDRARFDIVPPVVRKRERDRIETGLGRRVTAALKETPEQGFVEDRELAKRFKPFAILTSKVLDEMTEERLELNRLKLR